MPTNTTKCVRAHDTPGDGTEDIPTKEKKTSVTKATPLQHDAAPKAKVKPVPEPRKTLPERKGRNNHPGAIAKPRIKRTTAQVEAENVAWAEAKRWLEELEAEKKRLYAQIEIDEDERELGCQVKAIRRLSDVIRTDRDGTESEGEDFDMDVDASDSKESEDVNTAPKAGEKTKRVSCTDLLMGSSWVNTLFQGNTKDLLAPAAAKAMRGGKKDGGKK
jgi:hypothetical protein